MQHRQVALLLSFSAGVLMWTLACTAQTLTHIARSPATSTAISPSFNAPMLPPPPSPDSAAISPPFNTTTSPPPPPPDSTATLMSPPPPPPYSTAISPPFNTTMSPPRPQYPAPRSPFIFPLYFNTSISPPFNTTVSPPYNTTNTISKGANITKPWCPRKCGNLRVPYPFGIFDSGCALDFGFEIDCSSNPTGHQVPFFMGAVVADISDAEVRISNRRIFSRRCYSPSGVLLQNWNISWLSLERPSSFVTVSLSTLNRFIVIGCDENAVLTSRKSIFSRTNTSIGCASLCSTTNTSGISTDHVVQGKCNGAGCCEKEIPKGTRQSEISMSSLLGNTNNHSKLVRSFNPCGYAFIGEASRFKFRGMQDLTDPMFAQRIAYNLPIVLDWAIGNLTCIEAQKRKDYACVNNSRCIDSNTGIGGYRCSCNPGYVGNPYIGCQGYTDDGKKNDRGSIALNPEFLWIKVSIDTGMLLFQLLTYLLTPI